MTVFQPAPLYTLFDPDALARMLEQAYRLPSGRLTCQLIKATMRDTYEMVNHATGDRYIFQIYRHAARTQQAIEAELEVIQQLHRQSVPVAMWHSTRQNTPLVSLRAPEGLRYGVLFEAIDGQTAGRSLTPAEASACGEVLAACHAVDNLPDMARPQINAQVLLTDSLDQIADAFSSGAYDRSFLAFFRECAVTLRPYFARLPQEPPQYGLIHGDVIPSNILLKPDGSAVLIDFDLCGYGWRGYDIASFLLEIEYWQMGDAVKAAFLTAYQAGSPVQIPDDTTLCFFQAVRLIFACGVPAAHIQTWGRASFSEAIIQRHIALLKERMDKL